MSLAREFTPRVERVDPTLVLLDLQGLGRAWRTPDALGQALLEAARSKVMDPRVALASTRTVAVLVARACPGLNVIPPGGEAAALAPFSLGLLATEPEAAEHVELLQRWGVQTCGDLATLPVSGLAERLGPAGPRLRRRALGEDEAPLVPALLPESFEIALDLDWPVDGLEPLSFLIARVLDPLCASLVARGRRAAGLSLSLRLVDGTVDRRFLEPAAPSVEPRTWRTLLLLALEARPPRDAIQSLAVRATPTPARALQFSLFDPAQPSPEKLAETLARLHEWTASGRGGSPLLVDTHRPGAFAMGSFSPSAPGPVSAPPTLRIALRAFRPPLRAEVVLQDRAPAFVNAPGVRGAVNERAGPWRASGDWWDVAWSREEWDVALGGGGVYRIFYDLLRESWFVEGELD